MINIFVTDTGIDNICGSQSGLLQMPGNNAEALFAERSCNEVCGVLSHAGEIRFQGNPVLVCHERY